MNIIESTKKYEDWLGGLIPVIKPDITLKHTQMKADAFSFFRATAYRWAQLWEPHCSDLGDAPRVLSVGDLHLENFGTWRDAEGRLAWGVNDFDEAFPMAFTNDLVRLAVSALLASEGDRLCIDPRRGCLAIFSGYQEGIEGLLDGSAQPVVIDERHHW